MCDRVLHESLEFILLDHRLGRRLAGKPHEASLEILMRLLIRRFPHNVVQERCDPSAEEAIVQPEDSVDVAV